MKKQKSLRKLVFMGSFISLLTILIVLGGVFIIGVRLLWHELIHREELLLDLLEQKCLHYLEKNGQILDLLATSISYLSERDQQILLTRTQTDNPQLSKLLLLDGGGRIVRDSSGGSARLGQDLSGLGFFPEAQKAKSPYFSQSFHSAADGYALITTAVPIYDNNGRFNGMLAGELSLAPLKKSFGELDPGEEGDAFIVDADGSFVIPPLHAWVKENQTRDYLSLIEKGSSGHRSYTLYYDRGQKRWEVGSVKPMVNGWLIVVLQPASHVVRFPFSLVIHSLASMILGLILFTLFQFYNMRLVAKPISQLADQANRIAQGHYLMDDQQQPNEIKEITILRDSFIKMSQAVLERDQILEKRVRDRTRRIKTMAALGERLTSILDQELLLKEVITQIHQSFGYFFVTIFTLDKEGNNLILRESAGRSASAINNPLFSIPLSLEKSLIVQALSNGSAMGSDHVRREEDWLPLPLIPHHQSEIAIPILTENRIIGVLDVKEARNNAFDSSELDMFRTLANQVGAALNNARLYSLAQNELTERKKVEHSLLIAYETMESLVQERTAELVLANKTLKKELKERKKAEKEREYLRNLLRNIIDSMPSALIVIDLAGVITHCNREAEKITGKHAGKLIDCSIDGVLPYLKDKMDKFLSSAQKQQVFHDAKLIRKVQKEKKYEDITVYPLSGEGIKGAVLRIDDVTEQVKMEEMVIQSDKMLSLGGLAAGMAHEINNPLAGILQNTNLISLRLTQEIAPNLEAAQSCGIQLAGIRKYVTQRKIDRMLMRIKESGSRAAQIVQDMLSFSHKTTTTMSNTGIPELLDRTIELASNDFSLKKNYDFRNIKIIREYTPRLPKVPCVTSKIQQVFFNLLKNGAEAMRSQRKSGYSPCFILRIKGDNGYVRVEVQDNGPGISPEIQKRIFEPFFTTKAVGEGTGLGLSVSYFIITETHGGSMEVESVPGKGAKFILRLPLEHPKAREPAQDSIRV